VKIITPIVLSVLCAGIAFSQSYTGIADSIRSMDVHDSAKVRLLAAEARKHVNKNNPVNIFYLEQALPLAEKSEAYTLKSYIYNNLSNAFYDKGDYGTALFYSTKTLKMAEERNISDDIFFSYLTIGNIYGQKGDNAHARECFNKLLLMSDQIKNKVKIADIYFNMAVLFDKKTELDSIIHYTDKAYEVFKMYNDSDGIAAVKNNLGLIYLSRGEFARAVPYFLEAKKVFYLLGDDYSGLMVMNNLGDSYYKLGRFEKAYNEYTNAITLYSYKGFEDLLLETYSGLAEVAVALHKYDQAYAFYKTFTSLKDSLYSIENLDKYSELKIGYLKELDKKQIELLKTENELNENRQRTFNYIALGTGIFILVISVLFVNRYKIKQRSEEALKTKNKLIEEKQKEIVDSINYARRIQYTLLAHDTVLKENLNGYFVMFRPKDIVSGDFYWATTFKNDTTDLFYLAVCDSTGHGVPGAFMSLLSIGFLAEAINEKEILKPNEVLDYVRMRLLNTVNKEDQKDGFDGILLCINRKNEKISYAAANNNPVTISDGILTENGFDKMPVGKGERNDSFTMFSLEYKKGDMLYLFTDGYADQFGGPKGKKFKYRTLNNLLLSFSGKDVIEQRHALEMEFENWKQNLEQVDDVCVFGIRL